MGLNDCAKCCAAYSIAGAIFLFILGITLTNEYKYIEIPEDEISKVDAGWVCIKASVLYVVLTIACIGHLMRQQSVNQNHQELQESEVEMR